jgi:Cytochrome c
VDLAVSSDGTQTAIATPGDTLGLSVSTYPTAPLQAGVASGWCFGGNWGPGVPGRGPLGSTLATIAVAFDGQGNLVAQTRDPPTICIGETVIALPGASVANDGHDTFHTGTDGGIACASCHPEGGDDGRVWQFTGIGLRRTQNLRGGVLARTPFHWSGDIPDMEALVSVVLVGRMGGPPLDEQQTADLGQWMNTLPALAPPVPANPTDVARGAVLFNDPAVGCTACHNGPQLSNHQLVDVGTGGTFKVPSLIAVGYRAPYLHDGCAATLLDRFTDTACSGGEQHGHTAQLAESELADLVAYLQSL